MQLDFREYAYNELLWSNIFAGGKPGRWGDISAHPSGAAALPGAAVGGAIGGLPGALAGGAATYGAHKLWNRQQQPDPRHFTYYRDETGKVQQGKIRDEFKHLYDPRQLQQMRQDAERQRYGRQMAQRSEFYKLNNDPNEPYFHWRDNQGQVHKKLKQGEWWQQWQQQYGQQPQQQP
jgi:hypothetical protein